MRIVSFALTLGVIAAAPAQTPPAAAVDRSEFPSFDGSALSALQSGLEAKAMARLLVDSPSDARLPRYLMNHERVEDSLRVLRDIAEHHPDRVAQAFAGFPAVGLRGDSRAQTDALKQLVPLARSHLATLPREQAAMAARVLLNVDANLDRTVPFQTRLQQFIAQYSGTETALVAEVSALSNGPLTPARFSALDEFAQRHQGTCAAAHALHQKAFDLAHNASAMGERAGADPTSRFEQVLSIERELERPGAYPASCDILARAPDLVIQFSSYQPRYSSPDNIRTLLNHYKEFVFTHLTLAAPRLEDSSLAYFIESKMGDLFALIGDRVDGVESFVRELTPRLAEPDAARFLLVAFYVREMTERAPTRDPMFAKMVSTLTALRNDAREPYARQARAALAAAYLFDRDYARARPAYEEYLRRYPTTAWSPLALIRLGQTNVALGDLEAAVRAFDAAASPNAPALWRVTANAYAGDAFSGLGRADEALTRAERAVAAWDDDYGPMYRLQARQKPMPGDEPFAIRDDMTVTKDQVECRVSQLRAIATLSGAGPLERGRWLLARRRADDAKTALESAMRAGRGTVVESLARAAAHRAQLDHALELADVENPKADEAAALKALEDLGAEPPDVNDLAAKIVSATIVSKRDPTAADALMKTALDGLVKMTPAGPSPPPRSLEADLVAIRNEVFRPLGGGVYGANNWNAFTWPSQLSSFLVTRAELDVQLAGETPRRVTVRAPVAGLSNLIFLTNDDLALFASMIKALGGTGYRAPSIDMARVMETPNQPTGPSLDVRAFWNRYFPMRPGHWSGWVFETYPIINRVEFTDRARTKALISVEIGYAGATVVMVKDGGTWKATELINLWVT